MPVTGFDTPVEWKAFKKLTQKPQGVVEDAQIHPEMQPGKFTLGKKGNAVIITDVAIKIVLVSDDCWVMTGLAGNTDLLKHEQGHYDIVALTAREFYNKLLKLSAKSTHALQVLVSDLKTKTERAMKSTDARYDTQTNNSRNKQNQQLWDKKLAEEKQKADGSIDNLP